MTWSITDPTVRRVWHGLLQMEYIYIYIYIRALGARQHVIGLTPSVPKGCSHQYMNTGFQDFYRTISWIWVNKNLCYKLFLGANFVQLFLIQLNDTVFPLFRLKEHDFVLCRATLTEVRCPHSLQIDTTLVEPLALSRDTVVMVLGELDCTSPSTAGERLLKARIVRPMNGVDESVYHRALKKQKGYLTSRNTDATA